MRASGCPEAELDGAHEDGSASEAGISVHHPAKGPVLEPVDARLRETQVGYATDFSPSALAERVRTAAIALGFARIGFTPIEGFERGRRALREWLARDYHGQMAYMANGVERAEPARLLAGAKTLIVVALPYSAFRADDAGSRRNLLIGDVAHYARGTDYHGVLKGKLRELGDACASIVGRTVLARACVDSAPLLEREAAARAGVGFVAKSTMTIVPGVGTQVVLGELLIDLEIAPDAPIEPRCGQCTACLDACPTRAFVSPYVLDARRCISYLTIELRGSIPRELRALMGDHVFGCDVCQVVCPFNASPRPKPCDPELAATAERSAPELVALLELTSSGYRRFVKDSALRRTSRAQLARNAAVALGNSGDQRAVAPLIRALERDPRPLVRAHVAWALGQLGGADAEAALLRAENDAAPEVGEEARLALRHLRAET